MYPGDERAIWRLRLPDTLVQLSSLHVFQDTTGLGKGMVVRPHDLQDDVVGQLGVGNHVINCLGHL